MIILALFLLLNIFSAAYWFYFEILGYGCYNTLSMMIYNKALKHPLLS